MELRQYNKINFALNDVESVLWFGFAATLIIFIRLEVKHILVKDRYIMYVFILPTCRGIDKRTVDGAHIP
jgi:hypothetical protein